MTSLEQQQQRLHDNLFAAFDTILSLDSQYREFYGHDATMTAKLDEQLDYWEEAEERAEDELRSHEREHGRLVFPELAFAHPDTIRCHKE